MLSLLVLFERHVLSVICRQVVQKHTFILMKRAMPEFSTAGKQDICVD